MKKLMEKIKSNNNGFTLVELIVVIAILAIITVVVAPQYLSYVDKARVGTDENTIGEIAHVAEISYVEIKANATSTTTLPTFIKVVIDENGGFTLSSDGPEVAEEGVTGSRLAYEVGKVVATNQYKFKSTTYKSRTVQIDLDTNGIASWKKADGTEMGGVK